MKINSFNHINWVSLIFLMCFTSCSYDAEEVVDTMPHAEEIEMQTMTMCLHGGIVSFDASPITRSGGDSWTWQDDDVVYIQFHNGESLVRGYGQYDATSQQWEIYYSGAISQSDICEVYYLECASTLDKHNITFDETNAVYADKLADYHISDGVLYVSAMLIPLTSRVRFAGTEGLGMSVQGITHFTGYDADKNTLTLSSSVLSGTVGSDGYTQYMYGVFSEDSRHLTMTTTVDNGVWFEKDFPPTAFCVGESGVITIPTTDSNHGWEAVVTSVVISHNSAVISSIGATLQLTATIIPANDRFNKMKWTTTDDDVAAVSDDGLVTAISSGSVTIKVASTLDDTKFATCSVTIIDANGHEFVDLGLPSGLLWATMNIGATSPEDYGDYFAWGEIAKKASYYSSNYTYSANPSVLPLANDVANVIWGGNCRMPTKEDQEELRINGTWSWTTQSGKKGYKVTGPNGNSIFLPCAGVCDGGSYVNYAGNVGYYWSSSLKSNSDAYSCYFQVSSVNSYYDRRYFGQSVRAVCQ